MNIAVIIGINLKFTSKQHWFWFLIIGWGEG
ncbi:hypothetical protein [Tenacibaculum sp. SZ-18]